MLVHGYWQASWVWQERVIPALVAEGWHCLAPSLRGHGDSEGRIRGTSISDYVTDIKSVVHTLDQPPVIVGHSMGGFTAQHYLANGYPAAAAVLVSPVPRRGAWGATVRVARRHPWLFLKSNLTLDIGGIMDTPQSARDLLVAPPNSDLVDRYYSRLERASYRVYMDFLFNRPVLEDVAVPSLVVGGSEDAFFSVREWKDTADRLRGELVVIDGLGHQPMWEGDGKQLTAEILRFLSRI